MHIKEAWLKGLIDKGCARAPDYEIPVRGTGIDLNEDDEGVPFRSKNLGMGRLEDCPRIMWIDCQHPVEILGMNIEELADNGPPEMRTDAILASRRFRMGHIIEYEIVKWMELGGGEVTDTQTKFLDFGGRLKGFSDAVLNQKFVIEIKGLKGDKVEELKQNGTKIVYPNYYTQINMYMHYKKIHEGFLTVYNKNTSEIVPIYHQYDAERVATRRNKVFNILTAPTIDLVRIDRSKEDCEWCCYSPLCDKLPEKVGIK